MILVAGGTGRLGQLVVARLADGGHRVRVFSRDRTSRAGLPSGVERVTGDVRNRADLETAMNGVDVVVSAVQGFAGKGRVSPRSVDRDGNINLVDVAAQRHADVVLLSVVGASSDSPMDLFRAKWVAEQHLQASTAAWTIVRSAAFVETWAEMLQHAPIFGRGDNPINFVSVRDVAAAVERAVTDESLRGAIIELAGPEDLTLNELVALLRDAVGKPRRVRHIPRAVLRLAAPLSRLPRAALVMDSADFTRPPETAEGIDRASTDIASALAQL